MNAEQIIVYLYVLLLKIANVQIALGWAMQQIASERYFKRYKTPKVKKVDKAKNHALRPADDIFYYLIILFLTLNIFF